MRITAIELYHVSIPLKETFWPTWIPGYPQTHNRFTLIKLKTDEGIEGYSAGSAMGKERQGLGDLLGGYLIGADPTDIDRIQGLLKQAGFLGWRNFWIEPACWDILGKKEGKPVYELLGGKARAVPAYCSTGEMRPSAKRIDDLLHMHERGFKTAKLRVKNTSLEEDIKLIEAIRKGVGDELALGVDANQGWLVSIVDRVPAWDLKEPLNLQLPVNTTASIGWKNPWMPGIMMVMPSLKKQPKSKFQVRSSIMAGMKSKSCLKKIVSMFTSQTPRLQVASLR